MVYYTYILTNFTRSVLYTGVTNNLQRRLHEHYFGIGGKNSFTKRYKIFHLLYYECHKYINDAIAREKQIKDFSRKKKFELIDSFNPSREFLNAKFIGSWPPR
jgi:putative endonuclease